MTAVLGAATLTALTSAHADVGATQQVVLVADKPVKNRFDAPYRNWAGAFAQCFPHGGCVEVDPVAKGHLRTKLTAYQLKERVKKYNYFLLDVDTSVTNSGDSKLGTGYVKISNSFGPKLVDHTETGSVDASSPFCANLDLSLSTPWPVVSGAVSFGSVRFCSKKASFTRHVSGKDVAYKATMLGSARHLVVDRWVKVRAGVWPIFTVHVVVPRDTCTQWTPRLHATPVCTKFDDKSVSHRYRIYTS
jgi:hypothetical protein